MDYSAFDFPALSTGIAAAALITVAMLIGARREGWRGVLIMAGAVALLLGALATIDLRREDPRETHYATVVVGVLLPTLGAMVMQRAARRVRPWARWTLVFVTAFVLLFCGVLLGAAIVPRFL